MLHTVKLPVGQASENTNQWQVLSKLRLPGDWAVFVNGSSYKGYLDQSQHSICNTLHETITALWLVRISCDKSCALIGQSAFISGSIHSNYSVASQPPTWQNLLNSYCHSQKQDLFPSVDICGILWPSGSIWCWTLQGKSFIVCLAVCE